MALAAYLNYKFDELEDDLGARKRWDEIVAKCGHFLDEYWPEMMKGLSDQESAPLAGDAY